MPFSTERFFSGHCLILGNTPQILTAEQLEPVLAAPLQTQMEAFGLFNVATPNFNSFYPDITAEDLKPKDEDYVFPVMRALSETLINRYGPIDFTGGVLKPAMAKLKGQTVYPNHESLVGNEVGVVFETFWGHGYTTADGIKVPAGINARLKIDGKANPKLARGIQSDPPSIHSASVEVGFNWKASHDKMSEDEFFDKLGTLDAKGQLIRRIVTEIVRFNELSLVPHGQDPYAQKVDAKGKINNPQDAESKRYKFSAKEYADNGSYMDWKDYKQDSIKLNSVPTIPTPSNNNDNSTKKQEPMNEELLKFLRLQLGLAVDAPETLVLAKLQEQLPVLKTSATELVTANTDLTALRAKYPEGTIALSKEDNTLFTTLKASAATRLSNLKAEALKLYNLSVGGVDKAKAAIVKLINEETDETKVTALYEQYEAQIEETHKLTCQSCGGHNIKRASSAGAKLGVQGTETQTEEDENEPVVKTDAEAFSHFRKPKTHTSGLYQTKK